MTSQRSVWKVVLAKISALLVLTTLGGALIIWICSALLAMIKGGVPLAEAFAWRPIDDSPRLLTLIGFGIVAGIFGLGYLHVLLAYLVFLRRSPTFWRRLPTNFVLLLAGSVCAGILFLFIPTSNAKGSGAAMLIGPPIGFWVMSYLISKRRA